MSDLLSSLAAYLDDCRAHPRSQWPRRRVLSVTQWMPSGELTFDELCADEFWFSADMLPKFLAMSLDGSLYPFEVSAIRHEAATDEYAVTLSDYRGPAKTK